MVHPASHGLIGHEDPTLSKQILDVAEAQGEPDIKPDRLLDDFGREAVAAIADHYQWLRLRVTDGKPNGDVTTPVAAMKSSVDGAGSVWTWTAIEAETKLLVSHFCGARDGECAKWFIDDMASRIVTRIQLTSDGHKAYLEAVEGAFGADIDYAMLNKIYGASSESAKGRYSPAECVGCRKERIEGNPNMAHVSTSYAERANLTMRMHNRRFTRLTNAFSKKFENHAHMVAIYAVWYNWIRIHKTLRVTPAMAAGLSETVLDWTDIAEAMDANAPAKKRGSYKKSEPL